MSDRPEDLGPVDGDAAVPPPPPPPPSGALDIESQTSVRSGGLAGRIAAGAIGVALLCGGVAFAATQVGSDSGASDPESAVREMFDAIAAEDVLGVVATLDPDERDAIAGPVEQLFEELERLGVLDESFQLGGVDGVDLEFEDLTFRSEPLRRDLVRVHLVGGTASYAVDTDEIPVGDFLSDTFERFGVDYRGIQESESEVLEPGSAGDTFVVVRDTGDGWRISLGYTAVEVARQRAGTGVPVEGAGLQSIGASSPEDAVEGFLQAAVHVDVEGAVARLSPGEFRALHDYWTVLMDEADLPTRADLDADIELTDLELRSETDGDRAQVFVDSIGVDVVTDDFRGGGTIADGCVEVRGDVRETMEDEGFDLPAGPICPDDIEEILEDATGGAGGYPFGFGGLGGLGSLTGIGLGDVDTPALGITVVRVDGAWFVAPFGTLADTGLALLEGLERKDLDAAVDAVEEFFDGFTGMGQDFDGGFEEFEDFDGGSEEFEASAVDPSTESVLVDLVGDAVGDPEVADCALRELYATANLEQLYELADAFQYDFEPSPEAQDVLFGAFELCTG